jgi:phosphoribosyl 1,2-cyclic phosphate phosphodiesterase
VQIEFLGTGGAVTTPRPGCDCRVCAEARARGVPYSRTGPSLFVHGPNVLIDTPEEIKQQLNRSRVREIAGCLYSHWHPDHVMGRRVWETRNLDGRRWPPRREKTTIYLPQQVAADFKTTLGSWDHFAYLARFGVVELVELPDGQSLALGGVTIRPFRLAEDYVYAFLFEGEGKRVLIAPDELYGWEPSDDLGDLDLAVVPMGIADLHPLTGQRQLPAEHPILRSEATFEQTLEIVRKLGARRVVMTHVEEPDQVSYDDLCVLERRLQAQGLPIVFAHDTMVADV